MTGAKPHARDAREARDAQDARDVEGTPAGSDPYARLVLGTMAAESRIGLTLGFVRTFGVPEIARVLHGTGRMTGEPRGRAKATGAAMFALIGRGVESAEGRRIVDHLRAVHDLPGVTPELMRYVLACFTVCPLHFIDRLGHRPVTDEERDAAYAFHLSLARALRLPEPEDGQLADVERWMGDFERDRFAPSAEGAALWRAAAKGLLAKRLPAVLAPLARSVAAALLDGPLAAALAVHRPPAPARAVVTYGLRARSRRGR